MSDNKVLAILTQALLNKGLDYEVTLKGSSVGVRLIDNLTDDTIGSSTKGSLEEALSDVLASVISRAPKSYVGLSVL